MASSLTAAFQLRTWVRHAEGSVGGNGEVAVGVSAQKRCGDDAESTLRGRPVAQSQTKKALVLHDGGVAVCDDSLANFHFPVIGKISNGLSQSTRPHHRFSTATVYQSDGQLRVVGEGRRGKEDEGFGRDGQRPGMAVFGTKAGHAARQL